MPIPAARCVFDFPLETGARLALAFSQPRLVLTARRPDDIIPLLRQVEACAKAGSWAVGMVGYEAAPAFDPAFQVHPAKTDMPLAAFAIFDMPDDPQTGDPGTAFSCGRWEEEIEQAAYERIIRGIRDDIGAGRFYQTNFTTRLRAEFGGDAHAMFQALRLAQPDSYALFLDFQAWQLCSVSPELFFAWDPVTGVLTARPMKGTAAAGSDPDAADKLHLSAKNRAENLMIVDLLRNDIGRIAKAGSVQVSKLFAVRRLPTVLQMTSTVHGVTPKNIELADVFSALFPCGSVTGAPKIAAMRAIADHEASPRGAYCGALGVVMPGGEALFSVGIRTLTVVQNQAECGIGGGIIWDSTPSDEFAEIRIKRRFLLRATASFDLLETLRLEAGEFWLLRYHLDRLQRSAEHFGFVLDLAVLRRSLDDLAARHPKATRRVRLLVSRGGATQVTTAPLEPNPAAIRVMLAERPIRQDDEFLRHKTTERAVYDAFAPRQPDVFDTLLFNELGEITEFTRGNVIARIAGQLVTPPESCGLLPGTLRAHLLAEGFLTERVMTIADLARASNIWFINSLRGVIPTGFG